MNYLFILIVPFFLGIAQSKAQMCPVNFDSTWYKLADQHPSDWNGKIIAFDAVVDEIHTGYVDKLYFKATISSSDYIWIGSLVNSDYIKVNNYIRILGYSSLVKKDKIAKKYNIKKYHVLALAILDLKSERMSAFSSDNKQIKEWINGKVPIGIK